MSNVPTISRLIAPVDHECAAERGFAVGQSVRILVDHYWETQTQGAIGTILELLDGRPDWFYVRVDAPDAQKWCRERDPTRCGELVFACRELAPVGNEVGIE